MAVAVLLPAAGIAADPPDRMSGWLSVVWSDAETASEPATPPMFLLTKDDGTTVTLALDEEVLRQAGGLSAVDRKPVSLAGSWLQSTSGTPSKVFDVQSMTPQELPEAEAAPGGSQAWISILCKFSDSLSEPRTLPYFQNMYASTYPGLGHYWREQSYEKVDITGSSAAGWFTLPQPRGHYVYDMNLDGVVDFDIVTATQDCVAAADPSVYFPSYAGINMMFNETLDCCARGSGAYLSLDGVSKVWMTTWLPPWAYVKLALTSHEMGHGYGFPHSSGNYGATYDNKWDVMSAPSTGCELATDPTYGCLGQHTISYHKAKAGWIPPDLEYLAGNGTATVTLEQLALPQTGSHRMARIPIAGSSNFYTVEVRRHAGYDSKLTGQGVIVHEVDEWRVTPAHVIDVDGNGDTGDAGAILTPGEVFQDNLHDISIGVGSATATGYVITLAVNTTISTTLTSSQNPSLPGTPVTFTATVNNGATGSVTFNENSALLGTVALSGGTATFSKSYASAGSYAISAEYSGDLGSSSAQLTQTILTPVAAPANVVATAAGTASVNVTWSAVPGASEYRVYRSANNAPYTLAGSSAVPSFTDTAVSPNTAYLYRVRAVAGAESPDSNADLATTVAFTDPVLPGTRVKALHFTELLGAVNAVCTLAGQPPIGFTAPTPAASVRIQRQHILDLRNGLNAARSALGLSAVSYADPAIAAGTTTIKSAHVTDLRSGVQ